MTKHQLFRQSLEKKTTILKSRSDSQTNISNLF